MLHFFACIADNTGFLGGNKATRQHTGINSAWLFAENRRDRSNREELALSLIHRHRAGNWTG